jgi:hypothetical protein
MEVGVYDIIASVGQAKEILLNEGLSKDLRIDRALALLSIQLHYQSTEIKNNVDSLKESYDYLKNDMDFFELLEKTPLKHLSEHERKSVINESGKVKISLYKVLLLSKFKQLLSLAN